MRSNCKWGPAGPRSLALHSRGQGLGALWGRVSLGLAPSEGSCPPSLGATDRWLPFIGPEFYHPPIRAKTLSVPRVRGDCGRKPLVNCGVLSRQAPCGAAGWGKWPREAALPGICDVQSREAAARALAASPKTLNFPDSNYNQGGTEKQADWQMRLLPGCSAHRCWARGCASVEDPPQLLPYIYSSGLCSSSEPGAVHTWDAE